jgi:hypothetical protein
MKPFPLVPIARMVSCRLERSELGLLPMDKADAATTHVRTTKYESAKFGGAWCSSGNCSKSTILRMRPMSVLKELSTR